MNRKFRAKSHKHEHEATTQRSSRKVLPTEQMWMRAVGSRKIGSRTGNVLAQTCRTTVTHSARLQRPGPNTAGIWTKDGLSWDTTSQSGMSGRRSAVCASPIHTCTRGWRRKRSEPRRLVGILYSYTRFPTNRDANRDEVEYVKLRVGGGCSRK